MEQTNENHNTNADAKLLLGEAKPIAGYSTRKLFGIDKIEISVGLQINQATHEFVGCIYSDLNGNVFFAPLIRNEKGGLVANLPSSGIKDIKQLGVRIK